MDNFIYITIFVVAIIVLLFTCILCKKQKNENLFNTAKRFFRTSSEEIKNQLDDFQDELKTIDKKINLMILTENKKPININYKPQKNLVKKESFDSLNDTDTDNETEFDKLDKKFYENHNLLDNKNCEDINLKEIINYKNQKLEEECKEIEKKLNEYTKIITDNADPLNNKCHIESKIDNYVSGKNHNKFYIK